MEHKIFIGDMKELSRFIGPIKVDNLVSNLFNEKRYQDLIYSLAVVKESNNLIQLKEKRRELLKELIKVNEEIKGLE